MTLSIARRIVAIALLMASLYQVSLPQDVSGRPAARSAATVNLDRQAIIESEAKARLTLQSEINSKLSEAGDIITATLTEPLYVDGQLVLRRGTEFRGRIVKVAPAKRGQRSSHLSIDFDHIVTPSGDVPISAQVTAIDDWDREESIKANGGGELKGGHRGGKTVDNVLRGAQIGLFGGVAGAALGGAAGASGRQVLGIGAGGAAAGMIAGLLFTKGSEIRVRPGAILRIKFTRPVTMPMTSALSNSIQ
jgi:hypothetical protein